ncbi:MAG: hypothetical protein K1563_18580, partial [Candidatus Thiodiazotropha sp. (ex. Lucinisca nassula)]|nr:hypothetical protein [Candidatus Thiodiazotropha sp. (ex. Lucinisca nassula)]
MNGLTQQGILTLDFLRFSEGVPAEEGELPTTNIYETQYGTKIEIGTIRNFGCRPNVRSWPNSDYWEFYSIGHYQQS